jgi:cobalamin biosynthesis Mg chelatase CobN
MRASRNLAAVVLALCAGAGIARAQVIRPPNIQGPINAAKAAAEKTNEQTKAAERVSQDTKAPAQQKAAPQQAPQKAGAAPQKAGAAPQKSASKAGAKADTATGAVSQSGGRRGNQVAIFREAFTYSDGGRRDPFLSLMLSGELRPIFTDLTLTGVMHDPDPRKSLALLVDVSTGESYRVRVGQPLGRMRVQTIGLENITFSVDEFGLSRTETLVIDRTKKAGPAPVRRP